MPEPSQDIKVILTPLKPALIAGAAQRLPVLVRVHSPDPVPGQVKVRKPYGLALVIDRSGSMSGEPLREAVRCARHMIDRLAPGDTAALVAFDDKVRILVPAGPVSDGQKLRQALAQIHEGGSTNLHGGWKEGADGLASLAAEAAIARVILLSDGNANVGEVDPQAIAAQCTAAAQAGVTTSTYGLGRQFNEDLMVAMAKNGLGNHYYGDSAADLLEPFTEEFDLISSLFARHLKLSLGAPEGVRIRLLNDYPVEEREGFPLVRLPDLPWGAEAWAIIELEIEAGVAAGGEAAHILQVGVTGATPDGAPIAFPEAMLNVGTVSAAAWDALLPDPLVAERQAEVETALILQQARDAADAGDWEAIQALLATARARFAQYPWAAEVLEQLAFLANPENLLRFKKEALYMSHKMRSRLSAKEELSGLLQEEGKAAFLRRKKLQGKAQFHPPGGKGELSMPQLPSGRQVALLPIPLNDLLREGRQPGNIHKVLAIRTEADLFRYIDVQFLVPESEAGSQKGASSLHEASLSMPPGLACVPAGYRLSDWEIHAADWPKEDKKAFRDFLSGRAAPVLREYLATVQAGQAKLREAGDYLTRLLVGWWDAGCHPAQEYGWDASDVGSPEWDDYDMLAALGQACAQLSRSTELANEWQAAARLQAFWNICSSELPKIAGMLDAAGPVRDCALALRDACLLEPLDEGKRKWLHDQAVAECVQLWNALGEGLRTAMPQPCGIIELVVVSAEANRFFKQTEQGGGDAGRRD